MKNLIAFLMICLMLPSIAFGVTASSVTKDGITFTFDTDYEVGQFVNNDWWVVGPVTINSMSPAYVSTPGSESNGWQVDPTNFEEGFDFDCSGPGHDPDLVPALPYTSVNTVESIVKAISAYNDSDRACVQATSVLTVVGSIPAADSFRPPYMNEIKPFYRQVNIQQNLLPSLAMPATAITLADVLTWYGKFRMEHYGDAERWGRAQDSFGGITADGYKPDYTIREMTPVLRVMSDEAYSTKLEALSYILQFGIDKMWHIIGGYNSSSGNGHEPGHWVMGAFAAVMFDDATAKAAILAATALHEYVYLSENIADGTGLWGDSTTTDFDYWNYVVNASGGRSSKDPYGVIDGGALDRDGYQLITGQNWKSTVLIATLIPEMQALMTPANWALLDDYVSRYVSYGYSTSLDPCQPDDTVWANRGITWGADPDVTPFTCILDEDIDYFNSINDWACTGGQECGRFPTYDNTQADSTDHNYSVFTRDMWDAYYGGSTPLTKIHIPGITNPRIVLE